MGHDISHALGQKLDQRRNEGRLCAGGQRHCTVAARVYVVTTTDEQGKSYGPMQLCRGHAARFPVGYLFAGGVRVTRHVDMPATEHLTRAERQRYRWEASGRPAHRHVPDSTVTDVPATRVPCAICGDMPAALTHQLMAKAGA